MKDYKQMTKQELIDIVWKLEGEKELAKKLRGQDVSINSSVNEKIEAVLNVFGRFCIEVNKSTKELQIVSYAGRGVTYITVKSVDDGLNELLNLKEEIQK